MEWSDWAISWATALTRWAHIFAGILWIGQTWYFTWLDHQFEDAEANPGGKVWMVHSGGFYLVDKIQVPSPMPKTLHWFRWEAMMTGITGVILLYLVYFSGGLMIDASGDELSLGAAAALAIGAMVLGWVVYDLLWISPLEKWPVAGAVVSYVLMVGLAWFLSQKMAGRPAFLLLAAVLGTLMVNNVWFRIIPAQRAMIADRIALREPDPLLAARAKNRSKHNTFIIMPVLFLMISNHFPTVTYGAENNWQVFAVVTLLAWGLVPFLRRR